MRSKRRAILVSMTLALAFLIGCSDDDESPTSPDPQEPRVESIVISPESATFNGLGEEIQFDAAAFDQESAPIDTVFTWTSSDPEVVVVNTNGVAVATGLGSAEIYAMAGSVVDTADVTVTLDGMPNRVWIAGGSGDWENADNWSGGAVPGAGDVAMITAAGTYTVTINSDVQVEALVLGNESGAQTLDTNGRQLRLTTGSLLPGAELLVESDFIVQGDFVWGGGDISGSGTVEIESSAELHVIGNPVDLGATINNNGTIIAHAGCSLRVNGMLDNNGGGLVEFQGDAIVTVQLDGTFNSSGTIQKSLGEEEASILVSSTSETEFTSSGSLLVDVGSLLISGGSLSGRIDINADAMLRQSGNTEIRSANSQGDGPLVIGGRVVLGIFESDLITFRHLVLDSSGSGPALSGPAGLLIDHSLVWRRGWVSELGSLNTQVGSQTSFEDGGTKVLSATTWHIRGDVAGDSKVDLSLANGGIISLEGPGRWMQTSGGTIREGTGGAGGFEVLGEFYKTGEGSFVVETPFTCSGTLDLREGVLTVQGAFTLLNSGVITGGGTADLTMNWRLILIDASPAVMRGTIRPDLDGQPARLDILGLVDLESTFSIELDVVTNGPFNTESVYFLTGGQVFGGTLALNALQTTTPNVDYRMIYATAATGEFTVTGDLQFDEVIQDGTGVVGRRF